MRTRAEWRKLHLEQGLCACEHPGCCSNTGHGKGMGLGDSSCHRRPVPGRDLCASCIAYREMIEGLPRTSA